MRAVSTKSASGLNISLGALSVLYVTLGSRNMSVFAPAVMVKPSVCFVKATGLFSQRSGKGIDLT